MAYALTTAMNTARGAAVIHWILLINLSQGGIPRLVTLEHDITWAGETWAGAGRIVSIGSIEPVSDQGDASPVVIGLGAADPARLSAILSPDIEQRMGFLRIGIWDPVAAAIVADPIPALGGRITAGMIQKDASSDPATWVAQVQLVPVTTIPQAAAIPVRAHRDQLRWAADRGEPLDECLYDSSSMTTADLARHNFQQKSGLTI